MELAGGRRVKLPLAPKQWVPLHSQMEVVAHFLGRRPYQKGHREDGLCAEQIKTRLFPPKAWSSHLTGHAPHPIISRPSICLCLQEASPDLLYNTGLLVRQRNISLHQMGIQGPWELPGSLDPKTQEALDAQTLANPGAQSWSQGLSSR